VEANSTEGQGSRRAVAPSDDDDGDDDNVRPLNLHLLPASMHLMVLQF
jgi:hypothetical protein